MRAQPKFAFLAEYPFQDYYTALCDVLTVERHFLEALDDIMGTFPKITGVGPAVEEYVCARRAHP